MLKKETGMFLADYVFITKCHGKLKSAITSMYFTSVLRARHEILFVFH